jgi:transcriptional regulator with XRE-family HTH domain
MKLMDLAEAIEVSSAYLSAVETGKRPASSALVERIADVFAVDVDKRRELHQLAKQSSKFVQLQLTGKDSKSRTLATEFARRFPTMDEDTVDQMLQLIQHNECSVKRSVK